MKLRATLGTFLVLALALPSFAQPSTDYIAYLDTDNNASTGCSQTINGSPVDGLEEILTITAVSGSGQVDGAASQTCDPMSGNFGAPMPVTSPMAPPWPLGVGLGTNGATVVEGALPDTVCDVIRLRFASVGPGGSEDFVLTGPGGGPILLSCQTVLEIPTLSPVPLLLLTFLIAGFAAAFLRYRGIAAGIFAVLLLGTLGVGVAWAMVTLDGDPADWPSGALATDASGDAVGGADIVAVFAQEDANTDTVFVRWDVATSAPPICIDDSFATDEDTPVGGDVTAANPTTPDSDPNLDPITVAEVNGTPFAGSQLFNLPSGATVDMNSDGSFTYDPNGGFDFVAAGAMSSDTFTYTLGDGTGGSCMAVVTVDITGIDDPPTAVPDTATVAEDAPATTINVLLNDVDGDGGPISITSVTQPTNGTVVITNGGADLTYEPDPGFCNDGTPTDDFTYTLTPGGSSTTVAVTVSCVDDPPTAVPDTATVAEDAPATTIDVLLNDTDSDGGPISITSVTQPANGTVVITNGGADLTYEPDPDFCNDGVPTDDFTYTLAPGGSSTTVAVTVTCVDDPPAKVAGGGGPAAFTEGGGAVVVDSGVTVTDIDSTNLASATVTISNLLDAGEEILAANTGGTSIVANYVAPTLTLTGPDTVANFQAVLRSVTYNNTSTSPDETDRTVNCLVNDGTSDSNTLMQTVTVTDVNAPPMAVTDNFDTVGNTELLVGTGGPGPNGLATVAVPGGSVLANDTDPDATLPFTVVSATGVATDSTGPTFDIVTVNGGAVSMDTSGRFSYLPPRGVQNLMDSFTYGMQDAGGAGATGTVNINIINFRVWYVHNDPAGEPLNPVDGPNFGRSDDPFDLLAAAGAVHGANDLICVYEGTGTNVGMNAGIVLAADNVTLHGEHTGCQVNQSHTGILSLEVLIAPTATRHAHIGHTAGNAITVNATAGNVTSVEIRGVDLSSTGGNALEVNSAGANNVEVLFENSLVNGASAEGVDVNHGSSGLGTVGVNNVTPFTAAGNAFDARTTGSGNLHIAFTNNAGVTATAGNAIQIDGSGGAGIPIVTAFSGNSVSQNTSGIGFNALATIFDSTPGGNFDQVNAGAFAVGNVAGPNRVGGIGVRLGVAGNPVSGNLLFSDLDIASTGGGLIGVGSGAAMPASGFQLGITTGTINALNGPAVDLDPLTAAVTLATVTSTNSPTSGIALTDISGTFSAGGGSSITGATGDSFLISGGTVSSTYQGNITHSSGATAAVRVQGGHSTGTVVFDTGTISATGATAGVGLQFNNADGNYDFNGTTTLNGGDAGVDIENGSSGTFDFVAGVAITHAGAGPAFRINNSAATVDHNGSVNDANGLAVDVVSLLAGGSARFDGQVTASGAGLRMNNAAGTVDFANADLTSTATVDIDNNTAAITFADLNLNQTAGAVNAFDVNTGSSPVLANLTGNGIRSSTPNRLVNITGRAGSTVTFQGAATLQGTGGNTGINISGGTAANTVTFAAAVDLGTGVGSRITGGGVNMSGNAANSVVQFNSLDIFTNAIPGIVATGSGVLDTATLPGTVNINTTGNGAAALDLDGIVSNTVIDSAVCNTNGTCIDLTNLAATSISRLAALGLTCSAGTCFNGNAARTVEVTGTTSTIAATNAVGLNLTNTTIGANNATFRSIASSGAANGVVLNGTGTAGGLRVVGTGAAGSGGTITNTTNDGMSLTSTANLDLNWMTISNAGVHEIHATTVTNFSLQDSTVSDNTNVAGPAGDDEHGIFFQNLFGANNLIEDVNFPAINENGIDIRNTLTDDGNLDVLTIRRATFSGHTSEHGEHCINIEPSGTADHRVDIQNMTATINANGALYVRSASLNTSRHEVIVNLGDFDTASPFPTTAVQLQTADTSTGVFTVTNNTFDNPNFEAIVILNDDDSSSTATITGNDINGNTALPRMDIGIRIRQDEDGDVRALISGNSIDDYDLSGIVLISRDTVDGTGRADATITGNSVASTRGSQFGAGIQVLSAATNSLCADIQTNNAVGAGSNFFPAFFDHDIAIQEQGTSTLTLPGLAGGVVAFIQGQNTGMPTVGVEGAPTAGGATCLVP